MNALVRSITVFALLAIYAAAPDAIAQRWPSKPVRMIVPFAAGGVVDIAARAIAQELGQAYDQPVLVDNRPGANGNIGTDACAKAAPDGYTICLPTGVVISLNPHAYARMPFDPARDLVPVVHVGVLDIAIVVHASLPARSVRELIELAKAKPGAIRWASLGTGSSAHLYLEWLRARTGADFNHIPYKGQPPMVLAAVSGEVDISVLPPGVVLPQVKKGTLRVIAVMSGRKRSPMMPEVATFQEQGYDLDFRNWLGVFLPRGTPNEIVMRLNADVNKLVGDPRFVEHYLSRMSITATGGTPEEFAAFLKSDRETAAELVKLAKLHYD